MSNLLQAAIVVGGIILLLVWSSHRPSAEARAAATKAGWVIDEMKEADVPGCSVRGEAVGYVVDGVGPDGGVRTVVCCQLFDSFCKVMP